MNILIILCSLILAALIVMTIFSILFFNRITTLVSITGAYQADEYRKAVSVQKVKKPILPVKKEKTRGRSVVDSEELIDIADLPWEDGIKAIEDMGQ